MVRALRAVSPYVGRDPEGIHVVLKVGEVVSGDELIAFLLADAHGCFEETQVPSNRYVRMKALPELQTWHLPNNPALGAMKHRPLWARPDGF